MANKYKAGNYAGSGLSKSAYLAKQKAPKVTVKKSTPSPNYSMNPEDNPNITNQQAENYYASGLGNQQQVAEAKAAAPKNQKSSSKSSSSSKPKTVYDFQSGKLISEDTSNALATARTNAANAQAESLRRNSIGGLAASTFGDILSRGKSGLGNLGVSVPNWGVTEMLGGLNDRFKTPSAAELWQSVGVSPAEAGSLSPDQINQLFNSNVDVKGTGINPNGGVVNPTNVSNDSQSVLNGGSLPSRILNSGSNNNSSGSNQPQRTPQPVSNPYTPPPTSDISSIIKSLIEYQPDNTPSQNQNATVRRPVGMGEMSSGWASNGAGGYNLGGGGSVMGGAGQPSADAALTGTGQDENWLNMINPFYTPTASAQEMPQQMSNYQTTTNPAFPESQPNVSYVGNTPFWSGDNSSTATNFINDYMKSQQPKVPTATPAGGTKTGNPAQQFAQGATGGYKVDRSAEKASKKALDELIKSIKSQYAMQEGQLNAQYDTSTKQGTTALENAKQQDLLKLSGLFNFGANQDPNSEQRIQYQGRTNDDYAGQLKDLLTKLTTGRTNDLTNLGIARSKEISGAQTTFQSQLQDILAQQAKAQEDYQNQQWERNYKMATLNKKSGGSTSAGSVVYVGNNSKGEPVYRNTKTGEMQTMSGLSRGNNDLTSILAGMAGQGQQGGSWEIDPATGEKIWVTD